MATLDELFSRYGHPADEMNEKIYFYFTRADKIETFEKVQQADKAAQDKITSLRVWIELLKKYRKTALQPGAGTLRSDIQHEIDFAPPRRLLLQ